MCRLFSRPSSRCTIKYDISSLFGQEGKHCAQAMHLTALLAARLRALFASGFLSNICQWERVPIIFASQKFGLLKKAEGASCFHCCGPGD